jgi:hypothetical protein
MTKKLVSIAILAAFMFAVGTVPAQEVTIHHGFLFFASEKYTMDEKTYGIYEDGNLFEDVIKDNAEALSQFSSFKTWHTIAIVSTGAAIAACAFGGGYYMFEDDLSEDLGESFGLIMFAAGGGLLVLGFVFEFISWGSISSAAETYNKDLMDEGPALKLDGIPVPTVAVGPDSAHLALTWRF